MRNTDREWEAFGETDPYFGVLTHDQFRSASKAGPERELFFRTGETYIETVYSIIRDYLDPNFSPNRALDFGCGVGRLTIPIAKRTRSVVGVDISVSMLTEAVHNCSEASVANVALVPSDDRLSHVTGEFDFIHSYIVLQHIPRNRGMRILDAMLHRLSENGVGVVHVTYQTSASFLRRVLRKLTSSIPFAGGLANVARGKPFKAPRMQMNHYDVNSLLIRLHETGCHHVVLRFTNHDGHFGVVLFFRKQRLPLL